MFWKPRRQTRQPPKAANDYAKKDTAAFCGVFFADFPDLPPESGGKFEIAVDFCGGSVVLYKVNNYDTKANRKEFLLCSMII